MLSKSSQFLKIGVLLTLELDIHIVSNKYLYGLTLRLKWQKYIYWCQD